MGDIISFRQGQSIITHRISKVILSDMQKSYITKGDNNLAEDDEIVKYDDIIGKVIYVMPYLGSLIKILKNKYFFIGCITILILVMFNDIRVKRRKLERKKIREKYEKKSKFFF